MNSLFAIFFLLSTFVVSSLAEDCACGLEQVNTRIIHGQESQRGRYPWLVSLLVRISGNTYSSCGASVINDRYLMTAAHCLASNPKPSDIIAMVGAHTDGERSVAGRNQMRLKVDSIKVHEKYDHDGEKMDDDIALIKLATPLTFDSLFNPICLPSFSEHDNLFVYGWGRQNDPTTRRLKESRVLHEVEVDEVDNATCTRKYWSHKFIPSKQVCAGTQAGSCQGDSGGSLSTRSDGRVYQVAVVSFGPPGCGVEGDMKPDVYERVTAHMDWIQKNTADAKWCPAPRSPVFTKQNVAQAGKSYRTGGQGSSSDSSRDTPSFPSLPPSSFPGGSGSPVRVVRLPDGRIVVVREGPGGVTIPSPGYPNRGRF